MKRFERIQDALRRRGLWPQEPEPSRYYTGTARIGILMNGIQPTPKPVADVSLLDHCEPENRRREWDRYFIGFAFHAATKSKDSTKVGAVLVGPEGEVRLPAFNGPPRGVNDTPDRFERPAKYLYASHAESNLIAFAAREGIRTKGCTVYTTHQPCAACTRTLIQAGIAKVVYAAGTFGPGSAIPEEMQAASTMFREAGVICEALS